MTDSPFMPVSWSLPNRGADGGDRKSTRLNSSHGYISYAVFCLKKKKNPYSHPREHLCGRRPDLGPRLPAEPPASLAHLLHPASPPPDCAAVHCQPHHDSAHLAT